jgi:SAM-dependent methyltransferase
MLPWSGGVSPPLSRSVILPAVKPGLEEVFREAVEEESRRQRDSTHSHITREFALGRLDEGRQLAAFFASRFTGPAVRVLDLGAGNGGASFGLSESAKYRVTALDLVPNPVLRRVRRNADARVGSVVGSGTKLPFAGGSFDLVLLLETVEHVADLSPLGSEVMRVLTPGGMCMVTTPARLRNLLRDPHYGVAGLLLLPDALQKRVVKDYDVEHIFWTAAGVARHFPERARVEVLVNIPYPGTPKTPLQIAWYLLRGLLWDRIIIHKKGGR